MEYAELQNKLDAERLSHLNSIISEIYNFELEGGLIYTEQEQKDILIN